MAAYNKFNSFITRVASGIHAAFLNADTDTGKIYLSNTAPNAATHNVRADLLEITEENGYTAGGDDVANAASQTGAVITVGATTVVFQASGGSFGPFQYVVLYNDTPTGPDDPLIAWWAHTGPVTLLDGETFTVTFTNLFTLGG